MKDTTRSENRHYLQREKARALRYASQYLGHASSEEAISQNALTRYRNQKVCSCQMCCNPRKTVLWKGKDRLPIQERKALLERDDLSRE